MLALGALVCVSTNVFAAAPYLKTDDPIRDDQGRNQVMIDPTSMVPDKYPGEIPSTVLAAITVRAKLSFFHRRKALNLVADIGHRYTFTRIGMTSWAGVGVANFNARAD